MEIIKEDDHITLAEYAKANGLPLPSYNSSMDLPVTPSITAST